MPRGFPSVNDLGINEPASLSRCIVVKVRRRFVSLLLIPIKHLLLEILFHLLTVVIVCVHEIN